MRALTLLLLGLLLLACASQPASVTKVTPETLRAYPAPLQECVIQLTEFKRSGQQQGVQDAQLLWDPRYPHLAFDRFSLSLLAELHSSQDKNHWLDYVARQAAIQRQVEYQNLASKAAIAFEQQESCARQLVKASRYDPDFWFSLKQSPPVIPSSYQGWQRVIGLYPISKLVAAPSIQSEKLRLLGGFHQPLHDYRVTYGVSDKPPLAPQEIRNWFTPTGHSSGLNWPQLTNRQIDSLLMYYAPTFDIESVSLDDKPGQVRYRSNGRPAVNTNRPTLYLDTSFTRFHGQILLQLNYSLWFANRTAKSDFDPYAGQFDGVLFRLTLDQQGNPYILDSIHHCGCYHMVFALDPQLRFKARNPDIEAPVTLYVNPPRKASTLDIVLSHGEHMIKKVGWKEASSGTRNLTPLSYHQLRTLPIPDGYKSLFDQQGMLMASQRLERFYLWPFGVKSPGTTRQTGHHAIAFIGERHFDDPFMLESLFLRP